MNFAPEKKANSYGASCLERSSVSSLVEQSPATILSLRLPDTSGCSLPLRTRELLITKPIMSVNDFLTFNKVEYAQRVKAYGSERLCKQDIVKYRAIVSGG